MHLSRLCRQVYNCCHLSFFEHFHLKWYIDSSRLKQRKLNACCDFMILDLRSKCKGDVLRCLEGNRQQLLLFTGGINCSIILATFVKESAPGSDRALKLIWVLFVRVSCAVHAKQAGVLCDN
jgi:hypothetical protein